MRILAVIAEMGSGGAESIAAQLARSWTAAGHEVVVASAGGWRTTGLRHAGVGVLTLPLRSREVLDQVRSARLLAREMRRRPVDVVHAHNVRAAVAARMACLVTGSRAPVLATVHGLAPGRYRWAARLLRWCAAEVTAVSAEVAERLEAGGLAPGTVTVVPSAAVVEGLEPREQARVALDVGPHERVTLCLARVDRPKRHDLLLEAWRLDPSLGTLLVAGDGPGRERLERRSADLGLEHRVRWLGDRRDVGRLLSAADLLVLPSEREGLPVSVLEAMAAGVPVVASDVGGLHELPEGAVALVPAGSAGALARALADLVGPSPRRSQQLEAASRLVTDRYSPAVMTARYTQLVSGLADRRGAAAAGRALRPCARPAGPGGRR